MIRGLESQVDQIKSLNDLVLDTLLNGGKILTAGHGGSAAEAMHMSEELMGRFDKNRKPLPAVALVADPTLLTCIGNDYGFNSLFPRQVEALAEPGDLLVIFSTSGNGEGLKLAAEVAKKKGAKVTALLGKGGGPLADSVDLAMIVSSTQTARIQEAHQVLMHIVLEAVDRQFV